MLLPRDLGTQKKKEKGVVFVWSRRQRLFLVAARPQMEESWSGGDGNEDGDFEGPRAPVLLSADERAALSRETVNEVIQRYLHADWSARAGQYEVAKALWSGQDVVCTFPTSAGKTLIMMLPALLACHYGAAGTWVVCQPLEALRKTTVAKIKQTFFARTDALVSIWSDKSPEQLGELQDSMDVVAVLFCSPEQLREVYLFLCPFASRVSGLLVDEAHLRFAWTFRDYKATDRFSTLFPQATIGLFSATLDRAATVELARLMALRNVSFFTEQEYPELRLMKLQRWDQFTLRCIGMSTDQVVAAILALYDRIPAGQAVIVFAASYAKLAKLAEPFGRPELARFAPRLYCSAYSAAHKETTCDLLNSGRCRLVGATCALGAGVDLVNVGGVVFYGCPKTFSDATQGMGRAGRGAGRLLVEVVFATDSSSTSKADNRMRLLIGYCSESKSTKKVTCGLCQNQRLRPGIEGAAAVYKTCFDFEGVHCGRSTRPACKLVMCKVFDKLLPESALADSTFDCGRCSACSVVVQEPPLHSLVKYKGRDAVFLGFTASRRCQIREVETSAGHTVMRTSLTLVSANVQPIPPIVEMNDLETEVRKLLERVLEERFLASSSGMLLASVPSKFELAKLSKWSAEECAARCSVPIADVNTRLWFEAAQQEAERRAEQESVIVESEVEEEDDDDDEGEVGDADDAEAGEQEEEEEEGNEEAEERQMAQGEIPFRLSPCVREFMAQNLSTLQKVMAEQQEEARQVVSRRRARQIEQFAEPTTPIRKSSRKSSTGSGNVLEQPRRNTIN
jgi:hypothetical protein